MAPATGFEPVAIRLTVECSTAELRRITFGYCSRIGVDSQAVQCFGRIWYNWYTVMVIPTYARRIGITVRFMYVSMLMTAICALTLLHSTPIAALPIVNKLPIVGKPVEKIVNTVTDDVVEPVAGTVTDVLPAPVNKAVEAPVNAVSRVVDPAPTAAAPARQSNPRAAAQATHGGQPRVVTATQTDTDTLPSADTYRGMEVQPVGATLASVPLLNMLTQRSFMPNFAVTTDKASTLCIAIAILLAMGAVFARLLYMIMKYKSQTATGEDIAFTRQDLVQASVLALLLLATGCVSVLLLIRSGVTA